MPDQYEKDFEISKGQALALVSAPQFSSNPKADNAKILEQIPENDPDKGLVLSIADNSEGLQAQIWLCYRAGSGKPSFVHDRKGPPKPNVLVFAAEYNEGTRQVLLQVGIGGSELPKAIR